MRRSKECASVTKPTHPKNVKGCATCSVARAESSSAQVFPSEQFYILPRSLIEHNRFSPNCFAFDRADYFGRRCSSVFPVLITNRHLLCGAGPPIQTGIECTHLLHVHSYPRAQPQEPPCDHIHFLFPYMVEGISNRGHC